MKLSLSRSFFLARSYIWETFSQAERIAIAFFWPMIRLLVMAYTGKGFHDYAIGSLLIVGSILEGLTLRLSLLTARNIYGDVISGKLTHFFVSPLTLGEWITSILLYVCCMLFALLLFLSSITYLFFGYNFFSLGVWLVPLLINILLWSMAVGLVAGSIVLYYGQRTFFCAFIFICTFLPFGGLFYDISVMPLLAQLISLCLPIYHFVAQCKLLALNKPIEYSSLLYAVGMNILFFIMTLRYFNYMFRITRERQGL